jgi:hypothetical protein
VCKICGWSHADVLRLNSEKSMVLPIYRDYLLGPVPALFHGDDSIPYAYKAKNLGVTVVRS